MPKQSKTSKTKEQTHNPNAYAHADHDRKIKPDPQSEKNLVKSLESSSVFGPLESSSVLAPFWLRFELLESSSSWTESSFKINVLLESSAEAQPKRREMNQTDADRTKDRANQKGEKKNR